MNSRPLSSTSNASLTSASTASSASKHSKHAGNRSGSSASASKRRPKLYQSVGSEEKARLAVVQAFENSPETFLCTYSVKRIIGFGSNGVVLAALMGNLPVAIKVIYKGRKASQSTAPSEIQVLKHLTVDRGESHLLKYVDDWQDSHHFYLVTELFGSDWLAVAPTARRENLQPLDFSICFQHKSHPVNLEFSAGSSDLWAWAYAHRAHVWETSSYSHTLLPLRPVRQLVSQIALALSEMHAEGYYHGDIKVENILVQNNRHAGTAGPRVKLADFGHAKHVSCGIAAYGTPEMSAPEFLRGSPYHTGAKVRVNHNADCSDARAADVFALGMLTFMLLTEAGTLPERAAACASARITYADLVSEDSGFFPFSRCELADIDDDGVALINESNDATISRKLTLRIRSTPSDASTNCICQHLLPKIISTPVPVMLTTANMEDKTLYLGLGSEDKARFAVALAFQLSPEKLLATYKVIRVVGFGSNGVVLAARSGNGAVAIKIIYKSRGSPQPRSLPREIAILKELTGKAGSNSHLLKYVADWQDRNHFYLVTELFGSDWLASAAEQSAIDKLPPIVFTATHNNSAAHVCLPFVSGSSDLWAWSLRHRAEVYASTNCRTTLFPLDPIKQIVKQIAQALAEMHGCDIYHGDIKPENILVQSAQTNTSAAEQPHFLVRLADFGHARHAVTITKSGRWRRTGILEYGTEAAAPPEVLSGFPDCDGCAADMWALGIILFMLLHETGYSGGAKAVWEGRVEYDSLMHSDNALYFLNELKDVDAQGLELLRGLCMVDPTRRLTARQVVEHVWLDGVATERLSK